MVTDEQIIGQFRDLQKHEILDELINRHFAKVRLAIFKIIANETEADDLTQEVFLRVLKSIEHFRGNCQFSTWLHKIAINTTYSYLARKKRLMCQEFDEFSDNLVLCPSEEKIVREELKAKVTLALASLSPKLKSAIVLTVIRGMKTVRVAQLEGCSEATIYWRIHQARKILKQQLQKIL